MHHLAEVRAGDDLGRQRALVREVLQRRAQQADAVRRQRALAELVDDAQRPAMSSEATEPAGRKAETAPLKLFVGATAAEEQRMQN